MMKNSEWTFIHILAQKETSLLRSKPLIGLLIVGNLLGALIGFIYYFEIIGFTELYHPLVWILVPDCPMAVLLLAGVYLQGERQEFGNYNYFVFIQSIRAATITFLLITNFSSIDVEIVLLGHSLLLLQAIAILPLLVNMKINFGTLIAIGITIFNDLTDFYGFFGIFGPTLAQYSTFKPKFQLFVEIIIGLDFLLILLGLLVAFICSPMQIFQNEKEEIVE